MVCDVYKKCMWCVCEFYFKGEYEVNYYGICKVLVIYSIFIIFFVEDVVYIIFC